MNLQELIKKWQLEMIFQKSLMTSEFRTKEGKRIAFETYRTIRNIISDIEKIEAWATYKNKPRKSY